jgi:hypothetical protein
VRTRAFAPLLAAAALAAAPCAAAADPPTVRVKTAKTVVRATLGSNCWARGESSHVCADAAYPLPTEGVLPWRARAPFVVGLSEPVEGSTFTVCLARVADGREVRSDVCLAVERGADGKYRGRLPKNLRGANRLWIQIYGQGYDAQYSAAIAR